MNTETKISERDVTEFMSQMHRVVREKTGVDYVTIQVEIEGNGNAVWTTYADHGIHHHAASMEDAIAAVVAASGPLARAAQLREKAQDLISEAILLEQSAQ